MKFFLRETESWSAVNKSKMHKTEKVSVIIEPSDNRYNSDLVCMVLENSNIIFKILLLFLESKFSFSAHISPFYVMIYNSKT